MVQPILNAAYYTDFQSAGADTVNDILNRSAHGPALIVQSKTYSTPPGGESAGDAHVIASSPSGVWRGRGGQVALYYDGAWFFRTLQDGEVFTVLDESTNGRVYFNDAGTHLVMASL